MAAGQRKYDLREVRFTRDADGVRCDVEFKWGIEEAGGQVLEWRSNSASFSKAELDALLSTPQRNGVLTVLGILKTAVKAKASDLATATEE